MANRLRYGSVSILAKLLGIKTSQLSAWFNISRQTSPQNVERIARSVGISIAEVNAAANARRQDLALTKQLDRDTEDKIKTPKHEGLGGLQIKKTCTNYAIFFARLRHQCVAPLFRNEISVCCPEEPIAWFFRVVLFVKAKSCFLGNG